MRLVRSPGLLGKYLSTYLKCKKLQMVTSLWNVGRDHGYVREIALKSEKGSHDDCAMVLCESDDSSCILMIASSRV